MLHYLSVVAQKQWNVRLNVWQKLVSEKNVSLKFSRKSNDWIEQLFKIIMLSLVANARPQPWPPLIDGLVDDAVLQFSPDGDDALHWNPYLFSSASTLK